MAAQCSVCSLPRTDSTQSTLESDEALAKLIQNLPSPQKNNSKPKDNSQKITHDDFTEEQLYTLIEEDTWNCPMCTLVNDTKLQKCGVCGTQNPKQPQNSNKKTKRSSFDEMRVCTFAQCGVEIQNSEYEEHMQLHQLENDQEWLRLRRKYGFESDPDSTNYVEQYQRNLELDWAKQRISAEELAARKLQLESIMKEPDMSYTDAIIPHLRSCYLRTRGVAGFFTVADVRHYGSDRGDAGWGCGWRNIQMMCSYILKYAASSKEHSIYKGLLFDGLGYVPSIPVMQGFLEQAWGKGYDVAGASQLGNRIVNTKKLIGATECAALMRSFGFKAKVVDFYSTKMSAKELEARDKQAQNKPQRSFKNSNVHQLSNSNSSGQNFKNSNTNGNNNPYWQRFKDKPKSPYKPNKQMLEWVWNYFSSRAPKSFDQKQKFISPLYLQHEGHSRTIVGIEKRGNQLNLLLFDPSHDGDEVCNDLKHFKMNKVKKSLDTFTRDKYQIVYLEEGIIEEEEQWKIVDSKRIQSS